MAEKGFLTDQLRRVVEGESPDEMGIAESTYRDYRSRAHRRTEQAIEDLILVAQSPAVDHQELITPDDIFRLLQALTTPGLEDYEDGEIPLLDAPDDYTPEFQAYRDRIFVQVDKFKRHHHQVEEQ